jgi:hypothetical protein
MGDALLSNKPSILASKAFGAAHRKMLWERRDSLLASFVTRRRTVKTQMARFFLLMLTERMAVDCVGFTRSAETDQAIAR